MTVAYNTVAATADILTALGVGSLASGDSTYFTYNDDTYTGSLNQATVDLLLISAGADFRGNIGSPGGSFLVDCYRSGAGQILCGFGGDYWYQGFGSGSARHAYIEVNPVRPSAKFILTGTGQADKVVCKAGFFQAEDTADVDELWMLGGEAYLKYHATTKTNTIRFARPGKCTVERDFDDAYLRPGGLLVVEKSTVTPSTISLDGGGCDYAGGDIGTLRAEVGDLNFSRLRKPITITNMTITEAMNDHVIPPPSGIVITVTNLTQIGKGVRKWWS